MRTDGFTNSCHRFTLSGEKGKETNPEYFTLRERQEIEEADEAIVIRRGGLRILSVRATHIIPTRLVTVKCFHHKDG